MLVLPQFCRLYLIHLPGDWNISSNTFFKSILGCSFPEFLIEVSHYFFTRLLLMNDRTLIIISLPVNLKYNTMYNTVKITRVVFLKCTFMVGVHNILMHVVRGLYLKTTVQWLALHSDIKQIVQVSALLLTSSVDNKHLS